MRKNKQGMSVGVVSLIMIFVVFLLVSLAVLSLTTASANTRMAEKSLSMQNAYYEADATAQETLAKIDGVLRTGGADSGALEALGRGVVYDPETGVIAFDTKVSSTATLKSELRVEGNSVSVTRWQTVMDGDWQPDSDTENLWNGGAS
ncbi:hypothetical protein [Eubacterium limosum]|uniref:Type 4 fimbrial biogenesis protein PilX N-terminal domain-containing protein n=1 Tax=Eubacterium limosum TaxID=1736 RepID=A0ABT5UNV5_EUBLI|nr:hypothetical protein [Eubacterium limosum]MDE1470627.1 hypothetical protein [Eubacterium limosum]